MYKPRRKLSAVVLSRQSRNGSASQLDYSTLICLGHPQSWCSVKKVADTHMLSANQRSCCFHHQLSLLCQKYLSFSRAWLTCSSIKPNDTLIPFVAGRMGDTFPHTFICQDQRLRSGAKYSTLVQELGRLCRYPSVQSHQMPLKLLRSGMHEACLDLLKQALHSAYGIEHWQGRCLYNMSMLLVSVSAALVDAGAPF